MGKMGLSRGRVLVCAGCFLLGSAWLAAADFEVLPAYREAVGMTLAKAGGNRGELVKALQGAAGEQAVGMQFLVAHMPERDAKSVKAEMLLNNVRWAYRARAVFPWAKRVPEGIFLNDVLPYASLDERRDDWRGDFFRRFSKHVRGTMSQREVIAAVNEAVREEVKVEYNTKRKKANQSPYESMEQGMASCTGLSILLVDAFRAVGIPSRVAGTPAWTTKRGNHNWVEVWTIADKGWHFTEYYPDKLGKLDRGWLLADAARGNPESLYHSVYASSWKRTGKYFPLVWRNMKDTGVPAVNVTARYIRLGEELDKGLAGDDVCELRIHLRRGGKRVAAPCVVMQGDVRIGEGMSPKPTDDMNRYFTVKVRKGQIYEVVWKEPGCGVWKRKMVRVPKGEGWLVVGL